jgi:putative tricarboxylic transport membrane protein
MIRLIACLFLALACALPAQALPARAECIAPAKPGGGFDLTCRLVRGMLALPGAERATPVEVKYLPGGIGAVAFDRAVSQRLADPGVFIAFSSGSLLNIAQGKFGPHQAQDVRWLAALGTEYGIVAVRRDSTIRSLAALQERLRQDPAGAVFGAGGTVGSQDWIKAALLVKAAGRDHRAMRFVSYEGGGQAIAALKGAHVDVFCGDAGEARQAFEAGEIRLIAVLAPRRLQGVLSGVPTAREQGVDLVWPTVRGVYMGPGVPERDYLEWAATFRRVMGTPGFARLLAAEGLEPQPLTGSELETYVREQVERYRELARSLHLRVR